MTRFTSIALCLFISTAAAAGDRDVMDTTGDRDTAESSASAEIWPPPTSPFPPKPSTGPDSFLDGAEVDVELVGTGEGFRGSQEFDIEVDGELFTVSAFNNSKISRLTLYDADGELVVGHASSDRGVVIFDENGVVERGSFDRVDMSVLHDYGVGATLLTNNRFLDSFLAINGETLGDDDGTTPPGLISFTFKYNSDGTWTIEISIGW